MSFVTLAQVGEVQPDLPLAVDAGDFDIALVQHDQEFFAIRDECSHANVPLSEGDVEGCTVECYLHGSRFDLRTGEALGLPATEPVPVYPVRVVGDDIQVDVDHPLNPSDFLSNTTSQEN